MPSGEITPRLRIAKRLWLLVIQLVEVYQDLRNCAVKLRGDLPVQLGPGIQGACKGYVLDDFYGVLLGDGYYAQRELVLSLGEDYGSSPEW